jgi:hypothetical protein
MAYDPTEYDQECDPIPSEDWDPDIDEPEDIVIVDR